MFGFGDVCLGGLYADDVGVVVFWCLCRRGIMSFLDIERVDGGCRIVEQWGGFCGLGPICLVPYGGGCLCLYSYDSPQYYPASGGLYLRGSVVGRDLDLVEPLDLGFLEEFNGVCGRGYCVDRGVEIVVVPVSLVDGPLESVDWRMFVYSPLVSLSSLPVGPGDDFVGFKSVDGRVCRGVWRSSYRGLLCVLDSVVRPWVEGVVVLGLEEEYFGRVL